MDKRNLGEESILSERSLPTDIMLNAAMGSDFVQDCLLACGADESLVREKIAKLWLDMERACTDLVTEEMLNAGLSHLYHYHPDRGVSDEETVRRIFRSMRQKAFGS